MTHVLLNTFSFLHRIQDEDVEHIHFRNATLKQSPSSLELCQTTVLLMSVLLALYYCSETTDSTHIHKAEDKVNVHSDRQHGGPQVLVHAANNEEVRRQPRCFICLHQTTLTL